MPVSAPTGTSVPVLASAVVNSLPVAIPRHPESSEVMFSAPGFPQDEATIDTLEAGANILLTVMDSPQ